MIDKDKLRALCEVNLGICDEMVPYVGNCSAIDPEIDRMQEEWIRSELERGNSWAWCTAQVAVSYAGISYADSLGCCSYRSRRDFEVGGYYEDMVQTALDQLYARLTEIEVAIGKLERLGGYIELTVEQLSALRTFAWCRGRRWKSDLRTCWETGCYPPDQPTNNENNNALLQQIRNTFGPTWLTRFRLDDVSTHKVRR